MQDDDISAEGKRKCGHYFKKKTAEANGEYFNAKFAVRGRFVEEIR